MTVECALSLILGSALQILQVTDAVEIGPSATLWERDRHVSVTSLSILTAIFQVNLG